MIPLFLVFLTPDDAKRDQAKEKGKGAGAKEYRAEPERAKVSAVSAVSTVLLSACILASFLFLVSYFLFL